MWHDRELLLATPILGMGRQVKRNKRYQGATFSITERHKVSGSDIFRILLFGRGRKTAREGGKQIWPEQSAVLRSGALGLAGQNAGSETGVPPGGAHPASSGKNPASPPFSPLDSACPVRPSPPAFAPMARFFQCECNAFGVSIQLASLNAGLT